MKDVFINRASIFLPNEPVSNDEMEEYLGYVNNKPSRSKAIILRRNGIKQRYYALTKGGKPTHTNAEMCANAIRDLFKDNPDEISSIGLLACGTSSPDQILPSHAAMVHGCLPETSNLEIISPSGACCSGMHALKYAYMSLKVGDQQKAISTGSERLATTMNSDNYEEEVQKLIELEENPFIGFEKDFLRWMLSDGAGAFLLENKKNETGLSLRIDWMESCSFAHQVEPCMYVGGDRLENGEFQSYKDFEPSDLVDKSLFSFKQDVKLLSENIVPLGTELLVSALKKHNANIDDITYFLPHISSYFFWKPVVDSVSAKGIPIPEEKWFTNLETKGNVGSGSIYLMVEELLNSGKLKAGDQVLLMVPESSRFSYMYTWLTVC